jgi:putative nucleotide binding protein
MLMRYQKAYEEYGYVLNILPYPSRRVSKMAQLLGNAVELIGEKYFTLLEAVLKKNASVTIGERVVLSKGPESKIAFIVGRLSYRELSGPAQAELPEIVEKIVANNEKEFVEFFNKAQPISPRMHALELIPGVGKKYMLSILKERGVSPFKSFKDIKERAGIPDPVKLLTKRILEELMEENPKYRLFVKG